MTDELDKAFDVESWLNALTADPIFKGLIRKGYYEGHKQALDKVLEEVEVWCDTVNYDRPELGSEEYLNEEIFKASTLRHYLQHIINKLRGEDEQG